MRILGLDPGSVVTGYGVIQREGSTELLKAAGTIRSPAKEDYFRRLVTIHDGLLKVIEKWRPQEVAVEGVFAHKNVASAMKLGQARGVALLAAATRGLPIFEYSPARVKQALVGVGRAEKEQVRAMVMSILKVKVKLALDASDALAVALCHMQSRKLGNLR